MIFGKSEDAWMEEGFALLEEGEYERALKVADKLLKKKHTSGFEIKARAWWELGNTQQAIETLEEGLKIAPEIWVFWDMLGKIHSDEAQFQDALAAFQQVFQFPDADSNGNYYNIALTYHRMGEPDLAERELANMQVPEDHILFLYRETLRAAIAIERGQSEDALQIAHAILKHPLSQMVEPYELAPLYTSLTKAIYDLEGDTPKMREALQKAVQCDKSWMGIQDFIRELRNQTSDSAHRFRVMIEGRRQIEPNRPPLGYFANYYCVADSPEEALEFIREFEPEEERSGLKISHKEQLDPAPGELKGVYWAERGYTFFKEK
ncbi:MAG: hypothetical protein KIT45_10915 [Fimbriimonadia bacterium]|nr:hypothetical protein [Fimbriimonadia bacterium]